MSTEKDMSVVWILQSFISTKNLYIVLGVMIIFFEMKTFNQWNVFKINSSNKVSLSSKFYIWIKNYFFGHFVLQYLAYLAGAALAIYQVTVKGIKWQNDIYIHALIITTIRYLLFQVWGSITRLPSISRKHQIVKKGITFEQIDHEANWLVNHGY